MAPMKDLETDEMQISRSLYHLEGEDTEGTNKPQQPMDPAAILKYSDDVEENESNEKGK